MRSCLPLVIVGLLLARPVQARVFWRWRGSQAPERALAQAGAERGYTAPASVNGVNASLAVFRMPEKTLISALRALGNTFPDMHFSHEGGNMAIGRDSRNHHTLIVIQVARDAPVTVFTVQATGGIPIPAHPNQHLLKALPAVPNSRPVFHAADNHTGASLAVATTSQAPQTVLHQYAGQLAGEGWTAVFPPDGTRSMLVFLRDREIATLTAVRHRTDHATRITLLHKHPGRTTF